MRTPGKTCIESSFEIIVSSYPFTFRSSRWRASSSSGATATLLLPQQAVPARRGGQRRARLQPGSHDPILDGGQWPPRCWDRPSAALFQRCWLRDGYARRQPQHRNERTAREGGGGNSGASNTTGAAPGSTTPYGGPPSYCRNPMSIGDSHPLPSEGSPASAAPSPMQPSSVSQPTSVPSGDQVGLLSGFFYLCPFAHSKPLLLLSSAAHHNVTPSTCLEQPAQRAARYALPGPSGQEHAGPDANRSAR